MPSTLVFSSEEKSSMIPWISLNAPDSSTSLLMVFAHASSKVKSDLEKVFSSSSWSKGASIESSSSFTPLAPLFLAALIASFAFVGEPNIIVEIRESVDAFPESKDLISSLALSIGIPIAPAIFDIL